MEFNNTANTALGICQDIDFLCGTTTASYPLADKVRNINQAYSDVNRLIWECCDTWQYDDTERTDLPIAKTSLLDEQQDYSVPTTAQRIFRIEVLDSAGNWQKLQPLDYKDVGGFALPEYMETAGMPLYYDLVANSIFLYPKPAAENCTLTNGLAVYFSRDISLFTTASTTGSPGFAAPFHRILSLQAAIDFEKDPDQRKIFVAEKTQLIEGLKRFYSTRSVEKRAEITPSNKRQHRQYE